MYQTEDLGEFVAKNHNDIIRILRSKGYFDPDDLHDLSQTLYLNLAQYHSLESYVPAKGSFERYIYVILERVIIATRRQLRIVIESVDDLDVFQDASPPKDLSVLERINSFRAYCETHHVPRLNEINAQIKARASGKFLDCPGRFHYLRVRKDFLAHEAEQEN